MLAQDAQRSCGCPTPGNVEGQVGCSSGLVELVPVHGRGLELDHLKVLSKPKSFCVPYRIKKGKSTPILVFFSSFPLSAALPDFPQLQLHVQTKEIRWIFALGNLKISMYVTPSWLHTTDSSTAATAFPDRFHKANLSPGDKLSQVISSATELPASCLNFICSQYPPRG